MTLPPEVQAELRQILRERAGEWLSRFYRHELLRARTVRGAQIEAQQEFTRTVVQPLLKAIGGTLATFSPRGSDLIPEAFPQIAALQREIQAVVERGSDAVRLLTEKRMREIAKREASWAVESVRAGAAPAIAVPDPVARPWLGDSTERWFGKMLETPTGDAVRAWINTGIQQDLSADEIIRGLTGTRQQAGILADKPMHQLAALVQTASTHAATVGRHEGFKALGLTHYVFTATLDDRTSIQCAENDGKRFKFGEGPVPPLHPNCRSTTRPVEGSQDGDRASMDGPVPARTTFKKWLEGRTTEQQDEWLGRRKAVAWRAGRLSLKQMLGTDLEPLSVAELEEMERL